MSNMKIYRLPLEGEALDKVDWDGQKALSVIVLNLVPRLCMTFPVHLSSINKKAINNFHII